MVNNYFLMVSSCPAAVNYLYVSVSHTTRFTNGKSTSHKMFIFINAYP